MKTEPLEGDAPVGRSCPSAEEGSGRVGQVVSVAEAVLANAGSL